MPKLLMPKLESCEGSDHESVYTELGETEFECSSDDGLEESLGACLVEEDVEYVSTLPLSHDSLFQGSFLQEDSPQGYSGDDEASQEEGQSVHLFLSYLEQPQETLPKRVLPAVEISSVQIETLYLKLLRNKDPLGYRHQSVGRLFAPLFASRRAQTPTAAWLDSDMVDDYLGLIVGRTQGASAAISSLWGSETRLGENKFSQKIVQDQFKKERERLQAAKKIFWPISRTLPGSGLKHWFLLVIEKQRSQIKLTCLDALNKTDLHEHMFAMGRELITSLYKEKGSSIHTHACKIPRMNNSEDCGTGILYWAKKLAEGDVLNSDRSREIWNYQAFRVTVAHELMKAQSKAEWIDLTVEDRDRVVTTTRSCRPGA